MDTAFDNSNDATLDNLNQDIFQKSTNVLTDGDLDMDNKNTNLTSPSIDTLNNIQSYTIDNQKSSEIIDQNRISNDDYIIDENNRHSPSTPPLLNVAPLNGKASEFVTSDNYFGPESNVDDDTTTGSPVTDELNEKSDEIANTIVDAIRAGDELISSHGIHFENVDYLKTVEEVEECDIKKDVDDDDVTDHQERNFDNEEFENENRIVSSGTPTDLAAVESIKLIDAVLPEKTEDPIENPFTPVSSTLVHESGEESEDEWNYIKVNQNATENETQERNLISQETVEPESLCPELANDNQSHDDPEIVGIEELSLSDADMESQLNPHAKEFVPVSPSPTNTTPINNLDVSDIAATMAARLQIEDELVAQSPRKGSKCEELVDVPVPEENDFLDDIAQRPADLDSTVMSEQRPGSSSSQCSYQEMNLKEAMHGDEKQEYAPDALSTPDQAAFEINSTNGDHEEFINILNKSMRNQDVMNASFYNDGTSDSNNPFKVDLNAVHRLPTSDDENENDRVEVTSGTTYSFEDTEFGMNYANQSEQQNGAAVDENGAHDSSEPKSNESDSIAEVVQEMITENMAVLDECNLVSTEPEVTEEIVAVSATTTENIIDFVQTAVEPTAVNDVVADVVVEEEEEPAVVADVVSNVVPDVVADVDVDKVEEPEFVADVVSDVLAENVTQVTEPVESAACNLISIECLIPEPQLQQPIVAETETIVVESENVVEQSISNDIAAEPAPQPEPIAETNSIADVAIVGAAVAAATAVAATAAVAAAKVKSTKPVDPKGKTVPAKKPLSAGVTAAKPKAKPEATAAKTAPIPRPRTAVTQPPVKSIEKKPLTSSLAAKKPVNGDVKPTASAPAAKRPVSSTTALKSTTTARTGATTTTAAATKVTTTRLTTKTTTTTSSADAPKRIATTKTTTTTTSSTLKPRPASEKPLSATTRSPISKANTSATDKSTKDTVNKLQTTGARAPVSPRSTLTTSRTTTLAPKKADAAKVPSAAAAAPATKRPISSTQRAATATTNSKLAPTQKRPITSATNRATTLETVKKTTTSAVKKDTKSQANGTKESAQPKQNGNNGTTETTTITTTTTNGTHAFDVSFELNNAVNDVEPAIM